MFVHVCAHVHMFVSVHLHVGVGENRGMSLERWPWVGSCKAGGPKRTVGVMQRTEGAHWRGFKQGRGMVRSIFLPWEEGI